MLKLTDVTVRFGAFQALNNINIEVEEGELVVLLGANGAGKSTIFNAISGLSKPTVGDIRFLGESVKGNSPDRMVKVGVVQCPEGKKLFPDMTVQQNLMMGGFVHRGKKTQLKNSLEEVYELFGILRDKKDDSAGSLSGGQQQMLAIGRALMSKPKLIMLDEPSIGLAPLIVEQMFSIIQKINQSGTTVLLAEQNANAALKIADRGYVIENGAVVLKGSSAELFNNDAIRKAYIGA
ncbi:ABC transporter ATP-binding protein [Microbacterium sp. APC 3898]|uniref:ABC transporter ATP-binding protein n=1 Tax=Planococcus notacanthi TaxID=3035188 RepID=A0ABT7ZMH4_9BACL|nr:MULTISPECIES: ABC transporter ATP-binding protein [Terrabacteria group]MBF6633233.1 ABC transporter ATP-binding protein [Planococcus sp. (in: firmicutes)]MDN3428038.1 ABC transporter ATP-binding protein [Planococcus sp. APC 4016]MDN3498427.1 ABC transporter ATP-binding protein [Microbacterium sp. APC 3898]